MKGRIVFVLVCLAFSVMTAQDVKFTVEVSNDSILMGNYFELKYTIEGVPASNFEPPAFTGLDVVGGPNTSSSISIVNGDMSQSTSYSYYLQPRDIGNYIIPPAYIHANEEVEMETPPIELICVPNPDGIEQLPHQAGKRYESATAPKTESKPKRPRKKF